jgi:hypothetical protein
MPPTPPTPFRLTPGDRAALDSIAAHMRVDRTTAIRKLIYEETERRGLTDHAVAAFIARLIETYHANAVVKIATDGEQPNITISEQEPSEARAVLLSGVDDDRDELRIEDPEGPASLIVATTEHAQPGGLHWEGTLADLATTVLRPG